MVLLLTAPGALPVAPSDAEYLAMAAERGNPSAQVLLAIQYRDGVDRPRDQRKAAYWFEQAALQGSPYAQAMMGELYAQGRGVEKNLSVAANWLTKAATRGIVAAQVALAKMYLAGEGVSVDLHAAEHWLSRAAAAGDREAQYELSLFYRSHPNPARAPGVADDLLAQSAAQGYRDALWLLHKAEALGYRIEEELGAPAPDIHTLAQDGDREAQYRLAVRYEHGTYGEKQDVRAALMWFERAADHGHVMAMKALADIYGRGLHGTVPDSAKAAYWDGKAQAATRATQ
jgi:TPR repeat protein